MSFDKLLVTAIAIIVSVLIVAVAICTLHEQSAIASSADPVATACAMQTSPTRVSALCIIHEQQAALPSAQSLQPLHD